MPIDPLDIWNTEFNKVKPSGPPPLAIAQIAKVVDERVSRAGKMELQGVSGNIVFTWNPLIFTQIMSQLAPNGAQPASALQVADAWSQATLASIMAVAPLSFIGASAPPTTFSVVASAIIDPPSIVAGAASIAKDIASASTSGDMFSSQLPPAFLKAFQGLTVTITGIDSTPTPSGPLPLVAPLTAVQ